MEEMTQPTSQSAADAASNSRSQVEPVLRQELSRRSVGNIPEEKVRLMLDEIGVFRDDMHSPQMDLAGYTLEGMRSEYYNRAVAEKVDAYLKSKGYIKRLGWFRRELVLFMTLVAFAVTVPVSVVAALMPWSFWWLGLLLFGAHFLTFAFLAIRAFINYQTMKK